MAIILASQSPRRRELLGQMGLSFTVRVADIDEAMDPRLPPEEAVAAVSAKKASAVPAEADDVVIAADTIVVLDDTILGKPRTPEEAEAMLLSLSGRTHRVMTGVTVCQNGRVHSFTEITRVVFRTLSPAEIRAYVSTGDPMDKAGSYGIQGLAGLFVERLEGDYFNVMGLPLCSLGRVLRQFGVEILGEKG